MNKGFLHLVEFLAGGVFSVLTFLYGKPIYFGFALLFSIMFIVDSFWFFMLKFVLRNKMAAVGGEYVGKDNR